MAKTTRTIDSGKKKAKVLSVKKQRVTGAKKHSKPRSRERETGRIRKIDFPE
jgi:hypothetical protein